MSTAQDRLTLGPELAGALMTPEEFDRAEIGGELHVYELINGVLVVTPPPSEGERGPNELLGRLLFSYKEQHPNGKALDYTLPEHLIAVAGNRRRADRVIWAGLGRLPDVDRDLPAIVVEFVSAGRNRERDYGAKRREYLGAGIAEYWVIDRFRRRMAVYSGCSGRAASRRAAAELVVPEGEAYATPLLPGFELPVGRLFEEADRLREAKRP